MFHAIFRSIRPGKRTPLFLLILLAGCSDGPTLVRVSGTVTRDGKPVPNLFVHFKPEHGRPSWGFTDENGHYVLHYDKKVEGAVVGTHVVFVVYEAGASSPGEKPKEKMPKEMSTILAKYGNPATTPLKKDVSKDNKVIDLSLD